MTDLRFTDLRIANDLRLLVFPGHSETPWNAADWMVAVVGEIGELANKMKKLRRGVVVRNKPIPTKTELAEEFADIVIYLDLLASYYNIKLDAAVIDKFNLVSREIGADVFL